MGHRADSYCLDGSACKLDAVFRRVGGRADFTYVPDATHSMADVYARGGGRNALWRGMTWAMYAMARSQGTGGRP